MLELAKDLNMTRNEVKDVVNNLIVKGYLMKIDCFKEKCEACSLKKICPYSRNPLNIPIYVLTKKGLETALALK